MLPDQRIGVEATGIVARKGSFFAAMASLRRSGVYRQTPQGTLALWAAFALGLM